MWTEPGLDLGFIEPRPLYTFLLKVAARCNLACDYCYVYFSADQSWRTRPRFVSDNVVDRLAERISEHAAVHDLTKVQIILHGGEPLLLGGERIACLVDRLRARIPIPVHFGIQTNGTLLDEELLRWLAPRKVELGVSLDGTREMNGRRVFHDGKPSFDQAIAGIEILRSIAPELWAGLLVVVDLNHDPDLLYRFLAGLAPPSVDLVLPDHHHIDPPPRPADDIRRDAYGRWLSVMFDNWYMDAPRFSIRYFEEILKLLLGGRSEVETIGAAPVDLVIVETDGQIEPVDTLKTAGRHVTDIGLDIFGHSFDDAIRHPAILSRMGGTATLCGECKACSKVDVCGGGYVPHRYGEDGTFLHPSVYCEDLRFVIGHIHERVRHDLSQARLARSA
jgi:uncharacterized protein